VEGISALATGGNNAFYRPVCVIRDIPRGNAQCHDALRRKPGIAFRIPCGSIAHVVTHAVNFDRQPRFPAKEVERVTAGRMLTAKLKAARPPPEPLA
jgi:hypothetical protein